MKFLVGWQDSILKPVLVNTLTAAVLFVLALFFKPLVHSLFAPPNIAQYPLVCFAEPYSGDTPDERRVDFYIANLTDKSYSRDELIGILRVFNPQPDRPLGPDLRLVMRSDELGRATNAQPDTDFNKSKGQLQVDLLDNSRAVSVRVDRIEPHALMKVTLQYSGMRDVGPVINRMADILVPFDFRELQDRCFHE